MLGYYRNSIDICKKAGHSGACTEVTFIYQVDRVMDGLAVGTYDKGILAFPEQVKLLLYPSGKVHGLYLTWRLAKCYYAQMKEDFIKL